MKNVDLRPGDVVMLQQNKCIYIVLSLASRKSSNIVLVYSIVHNNRIYMFDDYLELIHRSVG